MKATGFMMGFLLLASMPALAQPDSRPKLDPVFCQRLVQHTPRADVAYRAGVDVRGRPVVPADLEEDGAFPLPETLTIPLTAELSKFLSLDMSSFPFNTMVQNDINLGTLTLRGDKVFLNEKPLSSAQQDNLAVLCLKPTSR